MESIFRKYYKCDAENQEIGRKKFKGLLKN